MRQTSLWILSVVVLVGCGTSAGKNSGDSGTGTDAHSGADGSTDTHHPDGGSTTESERWRRELWTPVAPR